MADVRIVKDQRELQALLRSRSGPTAQYLVRQAQRVVNGAKARCPVDTGNLRASINYDIVSRGPSGLEARVGTNVPYAIFVHEGTRYMAARPFLQDALNDLN